MKKTTGLMAVFVIAVTVTLPLSAGCNDCDQNGFPESIIPCANRAINQTMDLTSKTVEPVDFDTDGEPQLDEAAPMAVAPGCDEHASE